MKALAPKDTLLIDLIAELKALDVALWRLGTEMAFTTQTDQEAASLLLEFFQTHRVGPKIAKAHQKASRALQKLCESEASSERVATAIDKRCRAKLKTRYGIKY